MSGYDYTFVSEVSEEDTCPICTSPMKEPVQTKCGHRFCRFCLEESMKRIPECPIDREALSADVTDIFPDKASERKILDYQVKCPNENAGCQWIGELRNVEGHEASCFFVRVQCTNNCGLAVLRSELQRHLNEICARRIISCQHCGTNYVWCQAEEHFDNCQRFPCSCPQRCGENNIPKAEVNAHLERDCGLTEVDCKYAHVGCQVKVPRNRLERHLQVNMEAHLNIACGKLQILENESLITNQRLEELEGVVTTHNNLDELHNAISDKIVRLDELEESMKKTCQLHIKTDAKMGRMEAVLSGIQREEERRDGVIENIQRISQTLEDEIENIKRKLQELEQPSATATSYRAEFQAGPSGYRGSLKLPSLVTPTAPPLPRPTGLPECRGRFFGAKQLPEMMEYGTQRSQEHLGTSLSNKQCPQELSTEVHISNKFIWKFTQFDDCLQKAKHGTKTYYLSDPFQSGPYGYKMCIEFHPNGLNDGWNTHLSIFVCLMKSEYDDILPWPFNKKVIITLIDQQPIPYLRRNIQMSSLPKNNGHLSVCYSKPVEARPRNVAFGFCKFTTQERLKTRRYLVNDTLFLCVEVDRSNPIL
ncbi:TNF receptor-associated factor 5-like isoform X2 [Oculina patagonica]